MNDNAKSSFYDRFLAPWPLFAGVCAAFVACCIAGHWTTRHNWFANFDRFHPYISIGTLFYPTASQVRAIGKSRLDPDKIAVVIGGSSIMYGAGQRAEKAWHRELQTLLGDRFQVIDFGANGAQLQEFGGTAAEILLREHPRLIFVSDSAACIPIVGPDGGERYRYFFWDAYHKNLLTGDDDRDARLTELAAKAADQEASLELQRRMKLDSVMYFHDLWTTVAHEQCATLWQPQVGPTFTKPRKLYADPDAEPPLERRYLPAARAVAMRQLRREIELGRARTGVSYVHDCDGTRPDESEKRAKLQREIRESMPSALRQRTVLALMRRSPFYVDQLDASERTVYDAQFKAAAHLLEHADFTPVDIGRDYSQAAFCDYCHLTEEGGRRLAHDLAPTIGALARRLGYLGDQP
jgi:hypothetical protein